MSAPAGPSGVVQVERLYKQYETDAGPQPVESDGSSMPISADVIGNPAER